MRSREWYSVAASINTGSHMPPDPSDCPNPLRLVTEVCFTRSTILHGYTGMLSSVLATADEVRIRPSKNSSSSLLRSGSQKPAWYDIAAANNLWRSRDWEIPDLRHDALRVTVPLRPLIVSLGRLCLDAPAGLSRLLVTTRWWSTAGCAASTELRWRSILAFFVIIRIFPCTFRGDCRLLHAVPSSPVPCVKVIMTSIGPEPEPCPR
ncbi:hypothetical protein C8Q80DRAFT_759897 [Daedaleopsis nitida]|nr:hypothetical protein C8Q80DRAFT_759897 [Daedaleopsis nitida]